MKEWPKEHVEILKEKYPVLPNSDMLKLLPYDQSQIKGAANRHKLVKKMTCYSWSLEDEQKLIALYPTTLIRDLCIILNKTESQVENCAHRNKVKKDPEFKYQQALKTAFKPGTIPPNKGKKQEDYMSADQIEKTKGTRFKKGEKSITELYDGAITIRAKKNETPHQYIRLAKNKWLELQIHNWEQINGTVPEGHCLACKDGDTLNCDPSNWELITMQENMHRNSCSVNLKDGFVAYSIAWRDKELAQELRKYPEIIELKRQEILLKRAIQQHGK